MRRAAAAAFLAGALVLAGGARAEDPAWTNTAELYVLGAGLSGTMGVGPVELKVSATFDQILSNLEFGAMANYRGESRTFAIGADVMYTSLGTTVDSPSGRREAKVEAKEWLATFAASWRITRGFEVLGGARLTSLDNRVTLTDPRGNESSADLTKTWVDPIVGMRARLPLGEKWSLEGYGDVGGFGAASDFTFLVQARVSWQLSRVVRLGLAYRVLYQRYETGSGLDRFKWDVTTQGPLAAIGVRF
jgi:hypothetical protein